MEKRFIAGLGNPGAKYARTRHNIGWWVLDALAARLDLPEQGEKHEAAFRRGPTGGRRLTLLWPQTFMNLSGQALAQWRRREGFDPAGQLLVVYDDMDLPPGRLRLRASGSGGSHNGMKDVVERLGTQAVPRLRLGVGKPLDPEAWPDYVLAKVPPAEKALLESAVGKAVEACLAWLEDPDIPRLMNKVNAA